MFSGAVPLNLDVKGRMAMPSRFREELQKQFDGKLVVTIDLDRCLLIYPQPKWEKIALKLSKLPSFNESARIIQRLYIGHACECQMDQQGRFLLPQNLREHAHLDKSVVLVGQFERFELWDEEAWNATTQQNIDLTKQGKIDLPPEFGDITI